MQRWKMKTPFLQPNRYAAVFILGLLFAILFGCQQPTKQMQPAGDHAQKITKDKLTTKKEKEVKPKNPQKPAQPKPSEGKLTHQGLPIPKTLSKSPEDLQERIITETLIGETKPQLNGQGIPEKYIKKEVKYDITAAFDDNLLLDPAQHSIYPGAVLAGGSIDDGSYREITKGTKRKAVISFSLQGVKDKNGKPGITSGELTPNLAAYRKLHNEILTQKITYHASAHSSYEEMVVKSESSFDTNFKIGVGFTAAGIKTKIGSGFKFRMGENKNRYLIKFVETFYTVDVNQEAAPLMTDIPREYLGQWMPVYVSSVSYGRIAYLSIESDKSWKEIKPHLNTVLKASPTTAEIEVSAAIKKLNDITTTTINIIGGSAEAVTTLAQFRKYIVSGGFSSGNPGQIIKYKLRFLDDNATAHIKYAGQYTAIERIPVTGKGIKVTAAVTKLSCDISEHNGNAKVFGTIGIRPKYNTNEEEKIFNHNRDTNALTVPCKSSLDIDPAEKTITLPNSKITVELDFRIQEQKYALFGKDRQFVTDQQGQQNSPLTRRIEDLQKKPVHVFTVYGENNQNDTMKFAINFNVEYLF